MKPGLRLFAMAFVAGALASCTQPEKATAPSKASPRGSRVSAVGKVTMHGGQPCASQIMFDFRITGARSIFQVAAPMRETKLLTEAVKQNRRVRIWGNWQHGAAPGCNYVHVTRVEPLSLAVLY
jgi:hypothetical protein